MPNWGGEHTTIRKTPHCAVTHVENKPTKENKEGRKLTVTVTVLKGPFTNNFGDRTKNGQSYELIDRNCINNTKTMLCEISHPP